MAEALQAAGTGAGRAGAGDDRDVTMTELEQVPAGEVASVVVVHQYLRHGQIAQLTVDDHRGRAGLDQLAQVLRGLAGGDQQQPVDLLGQEHVEVGRLLAPVAVGVADDGAVAGLVHVVLEAAGEIAEEGVGDVGQDDADGMGAAPAHRACQRVGPIAQLVDGRLDTRRRAGIDSAGAVDDVGDGGSGDAGVSGDIADGGHG